MRFSIKWILAIVGLAFLYWFIARINLDWNLMAHADAFWVLASLLAFLLIVPLAAWRTHALLPNDPRPDTKALLKTEFAARFFYYVFPFRLNIPAKAVLLNRYGNTRKTAGLSACVYEFFVDSISAIVIALLGSYLFFNALFGSLALPLSLLATLALALTLFVLGTPALVQRIFSALQQLPNPVPAGVALAQKMYGSFRQTGKQLTTHRTRFALILALTAGIWTASALQTSLLFSAYGLDVPFWSIFAITAIGLFVGFLSQVPGGLGFREASMVYLFGLSGVDHQIALAVALWSRLATLAPIAIGAGILGRDLSKNKWDWDSLLKSSAQNGDKEEPHVAEKT